MAASVCAEQVWRDGTQDPNCVISFSSLGKESGQLGGGGFSGAQLGETAELQLCDLSWTGAPGPQEQPGRESDTMWASVRSRWYRGAVRSQGGYGWGCPAQLLEGGRFLGAPTHSW